MKVFELLNDPKKHCRNTLALDKEGYPVNPTDSQAVSWDLLGAISKCYPRVAKEYEVKDALRAEIKKRKGHDSIVRFSDNATWEEIQSILQECNI